MIDTRPLMTEFEPMAFRASKFDRHPPAPVHKRIDEALAEHILQAGLLITKTATAAL